MKRTLYFLLTLSFISFFATAKPTKEKHSYVRMTTKFGSCIVMLYNETPQHRDNFIKLVEKHFYDSLLFHRVIQNFMIQGGDPASKKSASGQTLGDGDVGYTILPEFNPKLYHKYGALAAARTDNPQKASSGCQFYIVQGKRFKYNDLDPSKYSKEIIDEYVTKGGTPHLDMNYTVFGEVVEGFEMVDRVAAVKTAAGDRPVEDVSMTVTMLTDKEVKAFEKKQRKKQSVN